MILPKNKTNEGGNIILPAFQVSKQAKGSYSGDSLLATSIKTGNNYFPSEIYPLQMFPIFSL